MMSAAVMARGDEMLTRPESIKVVRSKELLDRGLKSGELPCIRVGRPDSKRPRILIRRVDLERWLEGLTQREAA